MAHSVTTWGDAPSIVGRVDRAAHPASTALMSMSASGDAIPNPVQRVERDALRLHVLAHHLLERVGQGRGGMQERHDIGVEIREARTHAAYPLQEWIVRLSPQRVEPRAQHRQTGERVCQHASPHRCPTDPASAVGVDHPVSMGVPVGVDGDKLFHPNTQSNTLR